MELEGKHRINTSVISGDSAVKLLQIKHILPRQTTVNVQGTVTAVSEILRINKDCVFVTELRGGAYIVIKQPQFHEWHEHLVIGVCFTFTNLRPTTLSESYRPPQRVFIPWRGSKLFPEAADTSHLSHLDLQEWLACQGVHLPEAENSVAYCREEDDDVNCCSGVQFYQGVVTDVRHSEFNIFELDNKTRLFLCYLPQLKRPKRLSVGDTVTLHNVHQSVCLKTQKTQLFCCVRSTLRVAHQEKQPGEECSDTDSHATPDPPPVMLLQQSAVRSCDILPLLQLYQDVCRVMGIQHGHSSRVNRNTVTKILKYLCSSQCSTNRQRNYILEFCRHHALCPVNDTRDEPSDGMPQLTSLTHIRHDIRTSSMAREAAASSNEEDTGWTFSMKMVSTHLLGWLRIHPTTGRVQLTDAHDAMDLVVIPSQLTSAASPHQCRSSCDCSTSVVDQQPRCPWIHPCCLGCVIIVKDFIIVSEMFHDVGNVRDCAQDQKSKTLSYLVVASEDCVRLKTRNSRGKTELIKSQDSSCRSARTTSDGHLPEPHSRLVYITEKCHLSTGAAHGESQTCLQFSIEGVLVTPTDKKSDSDCDLPCDHADVPSDAASPRKKRCDVSSAPAHQRMIKEDSVSTVENSDASSTCQQHYSLPQCLQVAQPLSLTFEANSCRWFDLIHPPGLYRMVGTEGVAPLHWPQVEPRLQAAMKRTGGRMAVKVSPSAVVDKVFIDSGDTVQMAGIPSLQSALSDGCPGHLVSFRGVVMWRRHPVSQFPHHRAPRTVGDLASRQGRGTVAMLTLADLLDTKCLCVGVRDETEPSVTTTVYISTPRMVYPMGLLPGAVVDFQRLEKRTSKASNTYFSFLPVSSLDVLSGPSSGTLHKSRPVTQQLPGGGNRDPCWEEAPVTLLVDLWWKVEPPNIFVSECHVCQFFRLSLKSMCGQCGAVFTPAGCSAAACLNTHESVMVSRISVLVEDGSCQVLVNINRGCPSDITRKLLRMSPAQWSCLKTAVQQQGEVFLQKFGYGGGTALEELLSLLCDSRRIKRPCRLMLRKPFHSSVTGNKGTSRLEALTADEVITRTINTGEEMVDTLCLPYLTLDCLDIKEL